MIKPHQKPKNRSLTNRWQVRSLIARTGIIAVTVTIAGAVMGLMGIVGTGAVAVGITGVESGIVAGTLAGGGAWMGCNGIVNLLQGDVSRGSLWLGISLVSLLFASILFIKSVEEIEKSLPNSR
ncbi:MAG TPA: hypothetical protein DEG17_16300 [Cyanobacteria bacterium UBA11149]|nr:hypothetical protein [Cyanobacteria bacterium UBA11367]HBE60137.1 hypothetical protein [Cyanobacteria bacterium UBA11366]HBK64822.1 hypothetical protein [Cyanobacteria bacterium UBA11166]HBS72135.1 hypothetical protein [Cyanobacteria bacterium UBA11153]HBW90387.1 hypothetical protein [Cyanobacteria bacterium UBA11149]HCA93173.1 hypothetical protein [Cyanobacteria bacterium UBA9226]